jgi:hypothetical protein
MIQTTLAINELDCTIGEGNTPDEYVAIAVTLLRAAQAIRNREEGRVQCLGADGRVLASVFVHSCDASCYLEDGKEPPIIEELPCTSDKRDFVNAISQSMIDQYRRGHAPRPC